MVQDAATHINCIVDDYLDYVLCKDDNFSPRNSVFNLENAVRSVLSIYQL